MQNFEIGILPTSSCFFFSPSPQTQKLFYAPTMCGHFYCTDDYYIKRQSFPPLLLVYVCKGSFCLDLPDDGHFEAHAGQVMFFDCRQPHYYYARDALEFYYVHFDGPQAHELCSYISQSTGMLIDGPNNEKIREALAGLVGLYENGGSESLFAGSLRLYSMLSLLDNPTVSPRLRKNDDSIDRTIAYIRANVGKKIPLGDLAEMAGLSVYYYSHLFKEMTGQSPTEFVIYSRIDQAKNLLTNTSLPVSEIAQQVGYPNSSNLISLFTRRVGCPPAQYRRDYRTGVSH